jgi:hypothetical protein
MYSPSEYAFVNALIAKKDIKDCYRKAEIVSANNDNMFDLLWRIYLDFYAQLNPKMEVFIEKKQKLWNQKRESKHISYIIKNMFISKSTNVVFEARKYVFDGGVKIKIYPNDGKNPLFNLTKAIEKCNMKTIAHILKMLLCSASAGSCASAAELAHTTIIDYFEKKFGGADRENINLKWKNKPMTGCSESHYLLALIAHLSANEDEINNSIMVVVPKKEEMEYAF